MRFLHVDVASQAFLEVEHVDAIALGNTQKNTTTCTSTAFRPDANDDSPRHMAALLFARNG